MNINYQIINDETLLKEDNEIILWEEQLYLNTKSFSINCQDQLKLNLEKQNYILIGNSSNWETFKEKLENLNIKIYTYENSHTILFERV
ncbi:MAG: hypothetical protein PHX04_01665 [Bacilli bacterium]|nr:hypothetical protein [Bacilli bacterium]